MNIDELTSLFCDHIHMKNRFPKWCGTLIQKYPTDLLLYHQVIYEKRPDIIIETGSEFGGSALFFAHTLDMIGKGKVITIDTNGKERPMHDRVEYIHGSSDSSKILDYLKKKVKNKKVMVTLDADHNEEYVKREIELYAPFVTSGQYFVIEDCYGYKSEVRGPKLVKDAFLPKHHEFEQTDLDNQFLIGVTREGWLLRK